MTKTSPWVWVALIGVCFVAQFVFSRYHIDAGQMIATIFGVAVAALAGVSHVRTEGELTTLRRSIRPPSMPDKGEVDGDTQH